MQIGTGAAPRAVTIVDDEPVALDVFLRAARSWDYECQAATNAEEALELLERRPTPIIVTDLRMPGKGGTWLVSEIRKRFPEVAIIIVTAGDDTDAAIDCLNAGADRYFLKPVKLDEFHHALETSMETYRLKHERERYRRQLEKKVRRQTRQIRTSFLWTIESLVRTLEARDAYTAGHSQRVRRGAMSLGKIVGLSPRQLKHVSLAAKLHDIGKFGIPEAILNKPSRLTAAEDRLIREHPVIGEHILTPIIRSREVLSAIRGHHERVDGSGYPDGLSGEQIPLLARIVAIADCYDALTSCRAYRPALPKATALDFLHREAGSHFDPDLVALFVTQVVPSAQDSRDVVVA